ncbi:MAG: hypothetical protein P4L87_06565 [Formivibrio sp.]|nr:hypothetical protein [Formivibrio sp.]
MLKTLVGAIISLLLAGSVAAAQNCPPLPNPLVQTHTASADDVMGNFNNLENCANSNLAHNGSNSDITSLNGLTTPLSKAQGGTGNTTGQPDLVSVPLSSLASQNTNTVVGNASGSSSSPSALSLPSCADSGGSHLNWVSNSGFTCGNTSSIPGLVIADTSGFGGNLSSGVAGTASALSLGTGTWSCSATLNFFANTTVSFSAQNIYASLSSATSTVYTGSFSGGTTSQWIPSQTINQFFSIASLPVVNYIVTGPTTVYLNGKISYSSGSVIGYGRIQCLRIG